VREKKTVSMLIMIYVVVCAGVRSVQNTVTSSDGRLTINGSPHIARKNHQRKRPKAERTRRPLN